jgi:hypothetical protein
MGTDPRTERLPSTSTARTTVADGEFILVDGDVYRIALTFMPRGEVVDYLSENVSEAALAVRRGKPNQDVARALLDHTSQRYRFGYVPGRAAMTDTDEAVGSSLSLRSKYRSSSWRASGSSAFCGSATMSLWMRSRATT